jgi:hypothetical protein
LWTKVAIGENFDGQGADYFFRRQKSNEESNQIECDANPDGASEHIGRLRPGCWAS